MTQIQQQRQLPFDCEQMFNLVNDIPAYPKFVPWCTKASIIQKDQHAILAQLCLGWKGIQRCFTTQNMVFPHEKIELQLIDGPFDYLKGAWHFLPLADHGGCHITFELTFAFKQTWTQQVFSHVFQKTTYDFVSAFEKRAFQIYTPYSLSHSTPPTVNHHSSS